MAGQIANRKFVARAARMFALAEADGTLREKMNLVPTSNLTVLGEAAAEFGNLEVFSVVAAELERRRTVEAMFRVEGE